MSFDIGGIQGLRALPGAAATKKTGPVPPAADTAAPQAAVSIDLEPSGPPPELTSAFATAAAAYDRLEAAGARLHFATDPGGGLTVEVHDLDGNVKSTISGADALRIADGEDFR